MKKKNNVVITVISVILCIILLAVGSGLIYRLVVDTAASIDVSYDGATLYDGAKGFVFHNNNAIEFTVDSQKDFKVKVLANVTDDNDFSFKVGDNEKALKDYKYSDVGELTDGFVIEYTDDGFTIVPSGNLQYVLIKANKSMVLLDAAAECYDDMFEIVIYNELKSVSIFATMESSKNMNITLDTTWLEF